LDNSINEKFGVRLKALRDKKGMRQEDVGSLFKMQKSTVSQWESGRLPHPTIIVQLADYFNVTTDYLLGRTDSYTPEGPNSNHQPKDPAKRLPEEAQKSLKEFTRYIYEKHGLKPE